jgi:regulator of protease activity HflC (stomatin/prohibitin superfamily)
VAEGNKQAKILESEVKKQQLIIRQIYRQPAINVVEGNKQAKILESEAKKQQLIILNIFRQPLSMWQRETSREGS